MALKRTNGTTDKELGKLYRNNGTNDVQIGKLYRNNGSADVLIYQAQSDVLTITAQHQYAGQIVTSNKITNTDGYSKMVIENVSASGGNFGNNWARLYCNGVIVLDTGDKDNADFYNAIKSWKGTFNISQNGQVYVEAYTKEDINRDDYGDGISVIVKFHFE